MALFGVPLAYEDHAVRAWFAICPEMVCTLERTRGGGSNGRKTRYRPLSMKGLEPLLEAIKIHVDLSHVFPVRLQSTIRPSGRAQSPQP